MSEIDFDKMEEGKAELMDVFESAIIKYCDRCTKTGNTEKPWLDFSVEHLEKRLEEEIAEWRENKRMCELLDIINLSAFVHLAKKEKLGEGIGRR